jgi:hypothetical protein
VHSLQFYVSHSIDEKISIPAEMCFMRNTARYIHLFRLYKKLNFADFTNTEEIGKNMLTG